MIDDDGKEITFLKLRLHDAIYRLRFYSSSLVHFILLSNSHNNIGSIQKNRGDQLQHVIVALVLKRRALLCYTYSCEGQEIFLQNVKEKHYGKIVSVLNFINNIK